MRHRPWGRRTTAKAEAVCDLVGTLCMLFVGRMQKTGPMDGSEMPAGRIQFVLRKIRTFDSQYSLPLMSKTWLYATGSLRLTLRMRLAENATAFVVSFECSFATR